LWEAIVIIGYRLKSIRESKKLSQGDIEKRTGLLRCYISRVENGHTVPAIETLEKLARAMEIPMYQLFYDGDEPKLVKNLNVGKDTMSVRERREVELLGRKFTKLKARDKGLVRLFVTKLARAAS
jgi:transcriptional regulator with XRE-family HTH domain